MLLLSETQLLEKALYTCQTSFYMLLCFIFRVAFVVMYFMLCYLVLCILSYVFSHRGIFLCVCCGQQDILPLTSIQPRRSLGHQTLTGTELIRGMVWVSCDEKWHFHTHQPAPGLSLHHWVVAIPYIRKKFVLASLTALI